MCSDDGAFSLEYFVYFKKKRLDPAHFIRQMPQTDRAVLP